MLVGVKGKGSGELGWNKRVVWGTRWVKGPLDLKREEECWWNMVEERGMASCFGRVALGELLLLAFACV